MVCSVIPDEILVKKQISATYRLIDVHPVFQAWRNKQNCIGFQTIFDIFGSMNSFTGIDPENGIKIMKMRHEIVLNFLFIKIGDLPDGKDLLTDIIGLLLIFQGQIIQSHEFQLKDPSPDGMLPKLRSTFLLKVLRLFQAYPWATPFL